MIPAIIGLAQDDQKEIELKTNIGKLGITNADELIANEILKTIQ